MEFYKRWGIVKDFSVNTVIEEVSTVSEEVSTARRNLVLLVQVVMIKVAYVHSPLMDYDKEGKKRWRILQDFSVSTAIEEVSTFSEEFWSTTKIKTLNNGEQEIHVKVDGKTRVITEASVRRHLKLSDANGIDFLPNTKFVDYLKLMGYESNSQKLTFYKGFFSPQWKFLIHTILQCLSPKSTAWNEFSSNIAIAIICLANNRQFNFSKMIFNGMIKNLDNTLKKFLMYPRFIQLFLNKNIKELKVYKKKYVSSSHGPKLFSNMRRVNANFFGRVTELFPTMMLQNQQTMGEGSTILVETYHTPTFAPSSSQPLITQTYRRKTRKDTEIPQSSAPIIPLVADEAAFTSMDDRHGGAATIGTSFDAGQGSGNIHKTSSISHDSLPRDDTLESDEDSMKLTLQELINTCTLLKRSVHGLEKKVQEQASEILSIKETTSSQVAEIIRLKNRIKKLEEDATKQGRSFSIEDLDQDPNVTLFDTARVRNLREELVQEEGPSGERIVEESFGIFSAAGVLAEKGLNTASAGVSTAGVSFSTTDTPVTTAGFTTASTTVCAVRTTTTVGATKGVVIQEPVVQRVTVTIPQPQSKDKGKGIMQEPERPMKRKHQVQVDEEFARKLQAEEEEEVRIAQEKAAKEEEESLAFIAKEQEWESIQVKVETDYEFAKMEVNSINNFVDFRQELIKDKTAEEEQVQETSKRAGEELLQESSSKRKGPTNKTHREILMLSNQLASMQMTQQIPYTIYNALNESLGWTEWVQTHL
ncbi:hypothetical protein Tco_0825239, partial [Tanacetum coccineum]